MTLTLFVPHDKFQPTGDEPLIAQGMLKPGGPGSFTGFDEMRSVSGKLQLQFAQRQPGADVIGQFDLKVSVMKGGPRGAERGRHDELSVAARRCELSGGQ